MHFLSVLTELLSTPIRVWFHPLISPRPLPAPLALQRPVAQTYTLSSAVWPGMRYMLSSMLYLLCHHYFHFLTSSHLKLCIYSKLCLIYTQVKDDWDLFDLHVHVLSRELWYCICLNKSRFKSSLFNPLPQLSSHRASAVPEFKRKLTCSLNPTASNTRGKPHRKAENPTTLDLIKAICLKYGRSSFLVADVGEKVVDLSWVILV